MENNSSNNNIENETIQEPTEPQKIIQEPDRPQKEKQSFGSELFDWAEALVFALAVLVLTCAFIVRPSSVDGDSMYPTLHDKDQLLVSSLAYSVPSRGDVVVLMADDFMENPLVKRVIGIGGDVINITENGDVSVNNETMLEPYINEQTVFLGDVEFPFTVPQGQVFVMGDNRNASSDSRLNQVGTVPYEKIIGRVVVRLFPFNRMGQVK